MKVLHLEHGKRGFIAPVLPTASGLQLRESRLDHINVAAIAFGNHI